MNTTDDVKVTRPVQDVVLLEHSDPGARRVNIATNTYVLLNAARQALVVDGSFDYLLSPIQDILDQGYRLTGVALTHRHLVEHGALLNHISRTFAVPILLHPRDADMLRGVTPGLAFQDPGGHPLLSAFGVETVFFPGHTEGHVMYYRAADGLLMTGDAAMSTTRAQAAEGMTRLLRPPFSFNTDDTQLRRGWAAFDRPVRHVLPFHGALITDRSPDDMRTVMKTLQREEPTAGMAG